jgi:hypothetical protein
MLRHFRSVVGLSALLLAGAHCAESKPIAYAKGTTVMAEYGAGTMNELQLFYAPRYFYSAGVGHLALQSDVNDGVTRDITYARLNYLAKRWNGEASQGNIFVWGGAGSAHVGGDGNHFAWNTGAQADFETRRVYASLKMDYHESSEFSHRIDTLQLGIAPYEHDYETLATWLVVQARRYTGEIHEGTEWAFLLRLFKRNAWIEAGATTDGNLQAMLMFNF